MSMLDRIAKRMGYLPAHRATHVQRSFAAGKTDRLTFSFTTTSNSINSDLYSYLRQMRARSRDLWANNEYMHRFIQLCKTNVVGSKGVTLQARSRRNDGTFDTADNEAIERAWSEWRQPRNHDVTGRLGGVDIERLIVETVARDGEALLRVVRGYGASGYEYALQLLDIDRLDTEKNEERDSRTGTRIVMGVELDGFDRPVAYHLLRRHPEPGVLRESGSQEYIRVPARDVFHIFVPIRPEQVRGVPWAHAAILGLKDLGGYRESAIVAARVGAAKMGFWRTPEGDDDAPHTGTTSAGVPTMDVEAGEFGVIGPDVSLETWDPQYPHGEYEKFNKATLRGIAAGLGVAYHSLGQDLEGVNFSSARAGTLDERDNWMAIQEWLISSFHRRLYDDWLEFQLARGGILGPTGAALPMSRIEKFSRVHFQGRRWGWVDPLKDEQANALAYSMRTKSLTQIIGERGEDPDEVWNQIALDQRRLEQLGIPSTLAGNVQVLEDEEAQP